MKTFIALLLLTCLFHVPQAWAQCAPGIPEAGNPECLPPDDTNSPYYQGDRNQQPAQPQQPRAVWADRWGAIVVDYKTGQAGTTVGQKSKQEANQIAMNSCSRNGSANCELVLSFHNQCAAVSMGGGGFGYAGSPTKEKADALAINQCGHGEACKIVYSDCSPPVQVR
jgi:hypothetical protein